MNTMNRILFKSGLRALTFSLIIFSAIFGCKKKEKVSEDPSACFQLSASHFKTSESIRFTNCSSNYDRVEWYFGDGGESTSSEPDHKYVRPGIYSVRLKTFKGVNASEASKSIWIADTMRVSYAYCWDSIAARQSDLIVLRVSYQRRGEGVWHPTYSNDSYTSGNKIFWGTNAHIFQNGFIDVPNPTEALQLKIVAACYTGNLILPNKLVSKDSVITSEFDGFKGPLDPKTTKVLSVGRLVQQYEMMHR